MARLLDLPPEMFQNIIHHLVDDIGTCEAWKLRGTCRTFAAEITHDILSNEPEGRIACRACERIMKNKVSDFLVIQVNRTKDSSEINRLKNSPDGTRGFLTVIPKMLDYLGQGAVTISKRAGADAARTMRGSHSHNRLRRGVAYVVF